MHQNARQPRPACWPVENGGQAKMESYFPFFGIRASWRRKAKRARMPTKRSHLAYGASNGQNRVLLQGQRNRRRKTRLSYFLDAILRPATLPRLYPSLYPPLKFLSLFGIKRGKSQCPAHAGNPIETRGESMRQFGGQHRFGFQSYSVVGTGNSCARTVSTDAFSFAASTSSTPQITS
jgi:hypothetical protein